MAYHGAVFERGDRWGARRVVWVFLALSIGACGRVGFDAHAANLGDDAPMVDAPTDALTPDAFVGDLVAYYPMDTVTDAFQDAAGDHPARCGTTCPVSVPGQIDRALSFDGIDSLATVDVNTDLQLTTGFTVAAFVNLAETPTTRGCVVTKGLGTAQRNSWALCVEPSRQAYFFTTTSTSLDDMFSTRVIPVGEWHHLAIRWDGSNKTIFVDGDLDPAVSTSDVEWDVQTIRIGGDIDSGSPIALFHGAIDDLRIYDRPLTPQEIGVLAALP